MYSYSAQCVSLVFLTKVSILIQVVNVFICNLVISKSFNDSYGLNPYSGGKCIHMCL